MFDFGDREWNDYSIVINDVLKNGMIILFLLLCLYLKII